MIHDHRKDLERQIAAYASDIEANSHGNVQAWSTCFSLLRLEHAMYRRSDFFVPPQTHNSRPAAELVALLWPRQSNRRRP